MESAGRRIGFAVSESRPAGGHIYQLFARTRKNEKRFNAKKMKSRREGGNERKRAKKIGAKCEKI